MSNSFNTDQPALNEAKEILVRQLEMVPQREHEGIALSYDELKRMIAEHIRHLLSSHYEYLLNLLYRIDVDERNVADILANQTPSQIPETLADMIIERELQKVATRQYYRQ